MVRVQQQEASLCALLETVVILSFLCPKSCGISSTQFCLFVSFHYLELLTWYCTTSLVPAHLPGRSGWLELFFLAFLKTTAYSSLLIRFSPVMDITTTHEATPWSVEEVQKFLSFVADEKIQQELLPLLFNQRPLAWKQHHRGYTPCYYGDRGCSRQYYFVLQTCWVIELSRAGTR